MPTNLFDPHKNLALGRIITAPSPAVSGTSLVLQSGQGTRFPDPATYGAYNATVFPTGIMPTPANAEIVRITAKSSDTLTITRATESTTARTIQVGDTIVGSLTAKSLTDIEDMITGVSGWPADLIPSADNSWDIGSAIKRWQDIFAMTATITGNITSHGKKLVKPFITVGMVEPVDYLCDGTADDIQIQAAIAALPAGGGMVSIKEGTYDITATILVPDNAWLKGLGFATILKLGNSINASIIRNSNYSIPPNTNRNIIVSDMKLDGNKANQTAGAWSGIEMIGGVGTESDNIVVQNIWGYDLAHSAVIIKDTYHHRLSNIYVSNVGTTTSNHAIYYIRVYDSIFENINIDSCYDGLKFDRVYDSVLSHITSKNNTENGFRLYGCKRNDVSDLIAHDNTLDGFFIDIGGTTLTTDRNNFSNINCYSNGNDGFNIKRGNYNNWTNCIAYLNGATGFYFGVPDYVNYNTFTNCQAITNNQTNASLSGFYLVGVKNNTFINCVAYDDGTGTYVQKYGFNLNNATENNNLVGCRAYGNTTAQIIDAGTNNEVGHNFGDYRHSGFVLPTGEAIQTNITSGNTFSLSAYDVNGTAYIPLLTLTAGNDPTMSGTFDVLKINDTNDSHALSLVWNENDTSNRTLNFLVAGGDRSITLNENLVVGDGYDFTLTAEGAAGSIVLDKQTFEVEGEQTATRLFKLINSANAATTLTVGGTTLALLGGSNTFSLTAGTASLDVAAGKVVDINDNLTVTAGYGITLTVQDAAAEITLDEQNFEVEGEGTAIQLTKIVNASNVAATLTIDGTASVINQDLTTDAIPSLYGLKLYNPVNDASPEIRIGAVDAEELHIQSVYDAGAQTLNYVLFQTDVASATADRGQFKFNVDGTEILRIDDGGIEIVGGIILSDGTTIEIGAAGVIKSGSTNADTMLLAANDTTFITFTTGATDLCDLASGVTIGSAYIYRAGGTDVSVADGGTGASTFTDGGLLVGAGAGAIEALAVGATTQILVGGGAGTNPAWGTDLPTAVTIGGAYISRAGGTDILPADGGTGVSNGVNNTITFTGNFTLGLTLSNNTAVTLPTSGTLATVYTVATQTDAVRNEAATTGDVVILCDATAAGITVNLPTAVGNTAKFTIKKTDSTVNTVTIEGNAAETIDGALNVVINYQYSSITIINNNANWFII